MNKIVSRVLILLILISVSCKKDDEEKDTNTPEPSNINLIFAKTDVSCPGGSDGSIDISISGGVAPYSFAWSEGSSSEDISGLAAGSYIVNIMDSQGARRADTFMIEQPAAFFISEEYNFDTLDVSFSGGTPPYSFEWSTGDTTEDLFNYDYTECSVIVVDSRGCTFTKYFEGPNVLDGNYVIGPATAFGGYNSATMMTVTRNEVNQAEREFLFELYIPLKQGTEGFSIVMVQGSDHISLGPGTDWGIVADPEPDEPQDVMIQRGSLTETNEKFNITEDGLYHVVFDTELMKGSVCQAHWGIIGSATELGWSTSTALNESSYDPENMSWVITDLVLMQGDWKFRYSNGWKIILDTELSIGGGNYGVKVNTNMGESLFGLVPGGSNLVNVDAGIYTLELHYELGSGYLPMLTKTGSLAYYDYSETQLGLIGDGLVVNGIQHNWEETVMLHVPQVFNETNFYWNYPDVEVTTNGSFKIREGQDWSGFIYGYNDVIMGGSAADLFGTNLDGNIVPLEDGVFNMELFIDAWQNERILTIESAK